LRRVNDNRESISTEKRPRRRKLAVFKADKVEVRRAVRILLINHYAGSYLHGMEYRPFYMAREWTRLGHNVMIVAASHSHVRTKMPSLNSSFTEEVIEGVRYVWLKTPGYEGNGYRRAINIFSFVAQLFRFKNRIIEECKPDIVIASSTHPLDIFPARSIARISGAGLVFEVHDLWPLSPIELGGMSRSHPYIQFVQYAEDYAYRNADRVVSMLPNAEQYMRTRGLSHRKFAYVPNGIDLQEWQDDVVELPQPHSCALARLKNEGKFIVGYAGAHGVANSLNTLIEAAEKLRDQPVSVVLVGKGSEKTTLQKVCVEKKLNNVLFLDPVSKEVMPALLERTDVLYIGLQSQPLFRFGISPNKLFDYMIAGKPIIQAIEAPNDIVCESGCGLSIPPEDPAALADAVLTLSRMSPSERESMGLRGKQYVIQNHDYRILARKFLDAVCSK